MSVYFCKKTTDTVSGRVRYQW